MYKVIVVVQEIRVEDDPFVVDVAQHVGLEPKWGLMRLQGVTAMEPSVQAWVSRAGWDAVDPVRRIGQVLLRNRAQKLQHLRVVGGNVEALTDCLEESLVLLHGPRWYRCREA